MEREELMQFLRENLSIRITMGNEYESGGTYITSSVTILIDNEEITSDYDSVRISE